MFVCPRVGSNRLVVVDSLASCHYLEFITDNDSFLTKVIPELSQGCLEIFQVMSGLGIVLLGGSN